MKYILVLFIILFSLFTKYFFSKDLSLSSSELSSKDRKLHEMSLDEIKKLISGDMGPVVNRHESPELYNYLDNIFKHLGEAHERLVGAKRFIVNDLTIIDSLVPNAFVLHINRHGVSGSKNVVMITTELIRRFLEGEPGERLASAKWGLFESRIVGVLAHELAHPLDDYDGEGFKKNHGRRLASQAREIRADSEGAILAENAGYARDSVYQTLLQLFKYHGYRHTAIESALSTHPEALLRKSSQKLGLTFFRYQQGQAATPRRHEVTRSVVTEVDEFFAAGDSNWEKRSSIIAVIQELIDIIKKNIKPTSNDIIYFNRLIIDLGGLLNEKASFLALSTTEQEALEKWIRLNLNGDVIRYSAKGSILRKSDLIKLAKRSSVKAELRKVKDWATQLEKAQFFLSDSYREKVIEEMEGLKAGELEMGLRGSADLIAPWLGKHPDYDAMIRSVIQYNKSGFSRSGKSNMDAFADVIQYIPFLHRVYMAQFSLDELTNFSGVKLLTELIPGDLFQYSSVKDILPFKRSILRSSSEGVGVFENRMIWKTDSRKSIQAAHKNWMRYLWENRRVLIMIDFSKSLQQVDWEYIWQSLDLDKDLARQELIKDTKNFLVSKEFKLYLELIKNKKFPGAFDAKGFGSYEVYGKGMAAYFSGRKNTHLVDRPDLQKIAIESFLKPYIYGKEDVVKLRWQKYAFRGFSQKVFSTPKELEEELMSVYRNFYAGDDARISKGVLLDFLSWSKDIDRSQRKDFVLQALFSKKRNLPVLDWALSGFWMNTENAEFFERIYQGIIAIGIDLSRDDFFGMYVKNPEIFDFDNKEAKKKVLSISHWNIISFEKQPPQNFEDYMKKLKMIFDPLDFSVEGEILEGLSDEQVQAKKKVLLNLSSRDFSLKQKLEAFKLIVKYGGFDYSDEWFQKEILSGLLKFDIDYVESQTFDLLENKMISSQKLQVKMVQILLERELQEKSDRSEIGNGELEDLIRRINRYSPTGSLEKDNFLEVIAWRLNLSGPALKFLVQDQKSINWRAGNPNAINLGSVVAALVDGASDDLIEEMIQYVQNPFVESIPESLKKKMERETLEALLSSNKYNYTLSLLKEQAAELTRLQIIKMRTVLKDSSIAGKTTIMEMLLNGSRAPSKKRLLSLAKDFLGYSPDTTKGVLLEAFINVIPEHERSVTLAYLLASQGESSTVKSMFEVFQTVGIKFGQLAAIWNIFGDEITKEIDGLRDNALPLTKYEIENILLEAYGDKAKGIKLKRILGSASVKTVVEVELPDGKEAVLMVRRPFIKEQIETNLKLAKSFLQEARRLGIDIPDGMFSMIVEDLGSQLDEEINFLDEAQKMKKMKLIFEELNKDTPVGGYKFAVPQVIEDFAAKENIMIVEKASGKTWRKIKKDLPDKKNSTEKLQREVGENLFRSLIRTFSIFGFFNPDSHGGNIIIDEVNKVVNIIDLGQSESFEMTGLFSNDDRLKVSAFMSAYKNKKPKGLLESLLQMSAGFELNTDERRGLSFEINKVLLNSSIPVDKQIVDIISTSANYGLRLDRKFSFGIIKGLIILLGEKYVSPAMAKRILTEEFTSLGFKKFPVVMWNRIKSFLKLDSDYGSLKYVPSYQCTEILSR